MAVFKRYIDSGHSVEDVAADISCSPASAYRYYAGRVCPRSSQIRRICDKLGFDFEGMASLDTETDAQFEQHRLRFDPGGYRYLSRARANDGSGMKLILSEMAALLHFRLVLKGIPCSYKIDCNLEPRIFFDNPGKLSCSSFLIVGSLTHGPSVMWEYSYEKRQQRLCSGLDCPNRVRVLTEEWFGVICRELIESKNNNGKEIT